MDHQLTRLSKRLSYVLRHHPDKIGIQLDRYGRVDLQTLIQKFNQHFGTPISEKIIREIMKDSDKQRYAIEGHTIRALYGHSIPVDPLTPPVEPPEKLYHGTTHAAARFIVDEGLKKMDREAAASGLLFYPTESGIWLVDSMPAKFLKIINQ
ncbi:RNA 2'-phosphotransferase [Lentilactobacillus buchneri]|nr:RNA 2'-phosphotransferase [Lentilactobacillus sp. Egmn17]